MDRDQTPELSEGEYGIVRLPDAWHVLSLAFFVAALAARFVVKLIPMVRGPMVPGLAVLVLAALGMVFGLIGLRSPQGRSAARIALFLNATVLGLGILALAAFYYILPK